MIFSCIVALYVEFVDDEIEVSEDVRSIEICVNASAVNMRSLMLVYTSESAEGKGGREGGRDGREGEEGEEGEGGRRKGERKGREGEEGR